MVLPHSMPTGLPTPTKLDHEHRPRHAGALRLGSRDSRLGLQPGGPRRVRIDQSVTSPSDLSALINDGFRYVAQTFTAGRAGQLLGVEIAVTGVTDTPLRVNIPEP